MDFFNSKNQQMNGVDNSNKKLPSTTFKTIVDKDDVEPLSSGAASFPFIVEQAASDKMEMEAEEQKEQQRRKHRLITSDLLPYQCVLFLLTQVGYLAVVPSLLATTFFEPTMEFCAKYAAVNQTENPNDGFSLLANDDDNDNEEFNSLLVEWGQHCRQSPWTVWVSTALMVGGIFGSFVAGFLADRCGRKPVVVASMSLICLGNLLLAAFGNFGGRLSMLFVFFMIGTACGGYLVTNMVLLVEILRNSSTRLLVVSLNGWPLGMIGTALLAYFLRHWRLYHLATALIALAFAAVIQYFAFESIPWLIQSGKDRRAQRVEQKLIGFNSLLSLNKESEAQANNNDKSADINVNEGGLTAFLANNKNGENSSPEAVEEVVEDTNSFIDRSLQQQQQQNYTYLDLFRFRTIRIRLLTLLFCFGSSSIISFGLYFSAEVLPGSRYTNIAVMGLNKLVLGFLPFVLSNCMGRRPILLASVGFAMLAAWALIVFKLFFNTHPWAITALGLFITGAIDPNWKIIHLLSIELFPTPVRNMARALCNVVARLGSLSGPWVLLLRGHSDTAPFCVFATLLTLQLALSLAFLPETRGQPLPDQMPPSSEEEKIPRRTKQQKFRPRTGSRKSVRSVHSVDIAIS